MKNINLIDRDTNALEVLDTLKEYIKLNSTLQRPDDIEYAVPNMVYLDQTSNKFKKWNGSDWQDIQFNYNDLTNAPTITTNYRDNQGNHVATVKYVKDYISHLPDPVTLSTQTGVGYSLVSVGTILSYAYKKFYDRVFNSEHTNTNLQKSTTLMSDTGEPLIIKRGIWIDRAGSGTRVVKVKFNQPFPNSWDSVTVTGITHVSRGNNSWVRLSNDTSLFDPKGFDAVISGNLWGEGNIYYQAFMFIAIGH